MKEMILPDKEDKTIVVSVRVIDVANPCPRSRARACDDCGELTWISHIWKNKKIDKIVCDHCYFKNYQDGDNVTCTTEEIIQMALNALGNRGINVTREEIIKNLEKRIGRQIKIR